MTCRPWYVVVLSPTNLFPFFCFILSLLSPLVITLYNSAILPPCLPIQLYFFPRLGAFTPCLHLVFSYIATPLLSRQSNPSISLRHAANSSIRQSYTLPPAPCNRLSNVHPAHRHHPFASTTPSSAQRYPYPSLRRHILTQTPINKLHLNLAENNLPRPSSSQS